MTLSLDGFKEFQDRDALPVVGDHLLEVELCLMTELQELCVPVILEHLCRKVIDQLTRGQNVCILGPLSCILLVDLILIEQHI